MAQPVHSMPLVFNFIMSEIFKETPSEATALQPDANPGTPNTMGAEAHTDMTPAVDEPMVTYTVICAIHQFHT